MGNPVILKATVGHYGVNRTEDVVAIQQLLNQTPVCLGGPVLAIPVNGFCGEQTKSAIMQFQMTHLGGNWNGRVDPGSPALAKMAQLAKTESAPQPMEFLIKRSGRGSHFQGASGDLYYQIHDVLTGETALYWFGINASASWMPSPTEGTPAFFKAPTIDGLDGLECGATYRTHAVHGSLRSDLCLTLSGGRISIRVHTHLVTSSNNSMAMLSGSFRRIG